MNNSLIYTHSLSCCSVQFSETTNKKQPRPKDYSASHALFSLITAYHSPYITHFIQCMPPILLQFNSRRPMPPLLQPSISFLVSLTKGNFCSILFLVQIKSCPQDTSTVLQQKSSSWMIRSPVICPSHVLSYICQFLTNRFFQSILLLSSSPHVLTNSAHPMKGNRAVLHSMILAISYLTSDLCANKAIHHTVFAYACPYQIYTINC